MRMTIEQSPLQCRAPLLAVAAERSEQQAVAGTAQHPAARLAHLHSWVAGLQSTIHTMSNFMFA